MYIKINNERYNCSRRILRDDEVNYMGIQTEPIVGDTVTLCRDDGFEMAVDAVSSYARRIYSGTTLTYTNKPEPEPEPEPSPTTEDRVSALESENKTLKAQVSAQSEQMDFYEECIAEMASVVYA